MYESAHDTITLTGQLTDCFLEAGMDPAKTMKDIPPYYLTGSKVSSYEIPQGTAEIGTTAFSLCSSLTSITIPKNVTRIGDAAFKNCSGLTSTTIPNSATKIGYSAFGNCSSLTRINFTGTKAQWTAINRGSRWKYNAGSLTIYCTDGEIDLSSK